MKNYRGVIIKESLEGSSVLQDVRILSTRVERTIGKHQTPWLKKWTLHTVEVGSETAEKIAEQISKSFDTAHVHSWYADFDNGKLHYIIFPDKIFRIDMKSGEQYAEAKAYGISLGIPPYQVDFHPRETKWKRP